MDSLFCSKKCNDLIKIIKFWWFSVGGCWLRLHDMNICSHISFLRGCVGKPEIQRNWPSPFAMAGSVGRRKFCSPAHQTAVCLAVTDMSMVLSSSSYFGTLMICPSTFCASIGVFLESIFGKFLGGYRATLRVSRVKYSHHARWAHNRTRSLALRYAPSAMLPTSLACIISNISYNFTFL